MGNKLSLFEYPLTPPSNYSWFYYLLQCRSDESFEKDRALLFRNEYMGHVVEWFGTCTRLSKSAAEFFMNPAESRGSNLTLHYTPEVLDTYQHVFCEKEYSIFRASILNYSLLKNHVAVAMKFDKNTQVDYWITWKQFIFLFGSQAIMAPNLLFEKFWRSLN
jgi:hypothetical protein